VIEPRGEAFAGRLQPRLRVRRIGAAPSGRDFRPHGFTNTFRIFLSFFFFVVFLTIVAGLRPFLDEADPPIMIWTGDAEPAMEAVCAMNAA